MRRHFVGTQVIKEAKGCDLTQDRRHLVSIKLPALYSPRKDLAHDLTQLHNAEETSEGGVHWRKHMSLQASKWMGCNVGRNAHGAACIRQRPGQNAPLAMLSYPFGSSSCLLPAHALRDTSSHMSAAHLTNPLLMPTQYMT
jgi:hypothetical protein